MEIHYDLIKPITWNDEHLQLIDQRLLPAEEVYLHYHDAASVADAIRNMVVRGAPAIGITAAYGVVLAARNCFQSNPKAWKSDIEKDLSILAASRPTAINLFWALNRMKALITDIDGNPESVLLSEAVAIHNADIADNQLMGELGAGLLSGKCKVITHCNAGALATGGYGTALGVIRTAHDKGKIEIAYADETRPWLQGARLTAWELQKVGVPVRLLADGAAAMLMRQERPAWVIVGSDRIAANGDVANKIGTYSLAVNAKRHGVKFMVVAPTSTIDRETECGDDIPIEYRDESELLGITGRKIAPDGVQAWNPVFDVTPAELVDAIVTERGIVEQPDKNKMSKLFH